MRLTGAGKLIVFILVVGLAAGGWRWWTQQQAGAGATGSANNGGNSGFKLPKFGKKDDAPAGGSNTGGSNTGTTNTSGSGVEIPFVITAAKKDWVGEQVERFNQINGDKWRITTTPVPSREAMHSILGGNLKPVLWSPGSPVWPSRLAEAYSAKNNNTILDMSDPNAYRVFLRSPLVFLTTQRKAKFLRPLLGGNDPWGSLRQLSLGQKKTPWGSFRYSHADPLTSSSGVMTLGLILFDYGQKTGQSGSLQQVANSQKFISYLGEMSRSLVYDKPAIGGTTKLTNAFLEDLTRYDVITAYESAALAAVPKTSEIAVIYPNPTAVSEHAVSLLSGDWVSPEQREGALAFMQFLGSREALQGGLKYLFRPAQSSSTLSLSGQLSRAGGQGFQQTYSSVELPPYEALNSAAFQWHQVIKKKPQF
ncbi:MAG TPA: substrate-binding domain-containing protein [Abditibacteriaceae bacterium]|jgi:hypothetical protein